MAKVVALAFVLLAILLLAIFLPIQNWPNAILKWSTLNPVLSLVTFSGLVVVAMVLMFPVSIQAMIAGFVFGLGKGLMIMWLAGLMGFTVAFLLGRNLVRPLIVKWSTRHEKFEALEIAFMREGLMVVILARLSQVLPYNLLNYFFGLTSVSLKNYVLGSTVGMFPGIFMFVFLGTTATDLAAILSGEVAMSSHSIWVGACGVVLVATIVILLTRSSRRAFNEQLEKSKQHGARVRDLTD